METRGKSGKTTNFLHKGITADAHVESENNILLVQVNKQLLNRTCQIAQKT